eukprot:CFRG5107T1
MLTYRANLFNAMPFFTDVSYSIYNLRPATIVAFVCFLSNIFGYVYILESAYAAVSADYPCPNGVELLDFRDDNAWWYDYVIWKFFTPISLLWNLGLTWQTFAHLLWYGPDVVLVEEALSLRLFESFFLCFWWLFLGILAQKSLIIWLQGWKLYEHINASEGTVEEITFRESLKWWLAHMIPNITELLQFNLFMKIPFKLLLFVSDVYSVTLIPQLLWEVCTAPVAADPLIHPVASIAMAALASLPVVRRPFMQMFCLTSYSGMPWNDMYLRWFDCNVEVACLYLALESGWCLNTTQAFCVFVVGTVSWFHCARAVVAHLVNYYFLYAVFVNPQLINNMATSGPQRPSLGLHGSSHDSDADLGLLEVDWTKLNHAQLANYIPAYQRLLEKMTEQIGLMGDTLSPSHNDGETSIATHKRDRRSQSRNMPEAEPECAVCKERTPEITFTPCGHTVLCQSCFSIWQSTGCNNNRCLVCKTVVSDIHYRRMYHRRLMSQAEFSTNAIANTTREVARLMLYVSHNPAAAKNVVHGRTMLNKELGFKSG